MSRSANLLSCAIALLVAALLSGCADSSGIAARVGTSSVSQAEVGRWASIIASAEPARTTATAARKRAVRFLVSARWLVGQARQLDISEPAAEVNRQLRLLRFEQVQKAHLELLPADAQLRRLLLAPNVSPSDAKWLMRLNLLSAKVEQARLVQAARELPPNRIARFYATHKAQFVQPARRKIEIIGNNDGARVRKAKREIDAGAPFLQVARRASEDPEAPEGLQLLVRGTEEPPFEREIFGAKPHVLTGPVKQVLTYIFVVLSGAPDRQETLAQAEAAIRRELAPRRVRAVLAPAAERAWSAITSCSPGYVVQGCGRGAA
jgi:hypothetical protein